MKRLLKKANMNFFEKFSAKITSISGSSPAFTIAVLLILIWLITGPVFDFSESWQLVINTATTIITFLMVFLIQKSQNKESLAIQLKLNELVASHETASNRLVNVEGLTEDELKTIQKYYFKLSELAMKEKDIRQSHSIDEAHERNARKHGRHKRKV